ncbi:hypothetical protein [Pseudomonas huaxiensis]|uniref:hypothetical protein n=1 Tax=Pseudomonas huaxiensis TaxID=2213017 RepID=UPI000DA6966D|nr:hypothetical protein [Pseudomonas huaxiensis]
MNRWQTAKRLAATALILLLTVLMILAICLVTIEWTGGVEQWQAWLRQHSSLLRIWRLTLYTALTYGWWRMRQRLRRRGMTQPQRNRLRRAEISAVLLMIVMETQLLYLDLSTVSIP